MSQQTATEKSKEAINAIASGVSIPDAEKSRHLWLAAASLCDAVRAAEHAAFLVMRDTEDKDFESAQTFHEAMLKHLGDAKSNLVFMGQLLNGQH